MFGPGQQLYRIIPRTILSRFTDEKLYLHGGGYSERSFINIKDVAKATFLLATKENLELHGIYLQKNQ